MNSRKRTNGTGSAVYLGDKRKNPWGARITLGWDISGHVIRHFLGFFPNKLDALLCLQDYHNNPKQIYIPEDKYNRIKFIATSVVSPIIPTKNKRSKILKESISKKYYTFWKIYEEFSAIKFPTEEEKKQEKARNIKVLGKFSYGHARHLRSAGLYASQLHDFVYAELKTSHFQTIINKAAKEGYSHRFCEYLITLFKNLDQYAIQEAIISTGFSKYLTNPSLQGKRKVKTIFSAQEIIALHEYTPKTSIQELCRDLFIFALYTGCRPNEIFFTKTVNIHLEEKYFITGSKTLAGKNREIPIHPEAAKIIEKYYIPTNEFLFMHNRKVISPDSFILHFRNFFASDPRMGKHTMHECRHTFRTELERLNIKQVTINAILGHKNNDVGLDVYTHVTLEDKISAVNLIDYKTNPNLILFNKDDHL